LNSAQKRVGAKKKRQTKNGGATIKENWEVVCTDKHSGGGGEEGSAVNGEKGPACTLGQ